jgi:hypothetical protein
MREMGKIGEMGKEKINDEGRMKNDQFLSFLVNYVRGSNLNYYRNTS